MHLRTILLATALLATAFTAGCASQGTTHEVYGTNVPQEQAGQAQNATASDRWNDQPGDPGVWGE